MTKSQSRQQMKVAHMTFETVVDPRGGPTFALFAGDMLNKPKPLFTGCVEKGMGTELRRLAGLFDKLEEKL